MVSNLSAFTSETDMGYPQLDSTLPFSEYIARCQLMISKRRPDLQSPHPQVSTILAANSPFELYPQPRQTGRAGILFIHGLFDCPFSFRDIGTRLQAQGYMSKAILLPGHGTIPEDLSQITFQEWLAAVQYGIAALRQEVDHLFLMGYSTGATLAIYQALQMEQLAGVILLAPAIRIKTSMRLIQAYRFLKNRFTPHKDWIYLTKETNYTKYQSIAFNPIHQLVQLIRLMQQPLEQPMLRCPILMVQSREDETISSEAATHFFERQTHANSRLLFYSARPDTFADQRIMVRSGQFTENHIRHLSHVGLPFAPDNPHYGIHGDYHYLKDPIDKTIMYGAYNRVQANLYRFLFELGLTKYQCRALAYNPDFDFMLEQIVQFIQQN